MKYIRVPLTNLIRVRKIITCFSDTNTPEYRSGVESHDFWELVCLRRGRLIARTGEEEFAVSSGEGILHAPGSLHALRGDGKNPLDFFIISFESSSPVLQGLAGRVFSIASEYRALTDRILEEREACFEVAFMPMTLRTDAPIGGPQMIQLYLEQLLIGILRTEAASTKTSLFTSRREMERRVASDIRKYLEAHLRDAVDMEELCRRFHYGKSRLSAIFRETYDESVMHFYLRRKIEQAESMLRTTEKSIADISAELQFDSPQYFSRIFRKYTGMCPRDYKAKGR